MKSKSPSHRFVHAPVAPSFGTTNIGVPIPPLKRHPCPPYSTVPVAHLEDVNSARVEPRVRARDDVGGTGRVDVVIVDEREVRTRSPERCRGCRCSAPQWPDGPHANTLTPLWGVRRHGCRIEHRRSPRRPSSHSRWRRRSVSRPTRRDDDRDPGGLPADTCVHGRQESIGRLAGTPEAQAQATTEVAQPGGRRLRLWFLEGRRRTSRAPPTARPRQSVRAARAVSALAVVHSSSGRTTPCSCPAKRPFAESPSPGILDVERDRVVAAGVRVQLRACRASRRRRRP